MINVSLIFVYDLMVNKTSESKKKLNLFSRVICLGRLGSWFFQKRLNKNSSNLTKLREEKKKIIEKVMDSETYKVCKQK